MKMDEVKAEQNILDGMFEYIDLRCEDSNTECGVGSIISRIIPLEIFREEAFDIDGFWKRVGQKLAYQYKLKEKMGNKYIDKLNIVDIDLNWLQLKYAYKPIIDIEIELNKEAIREGLRFFLDQYNVLKEDNNGERVKIGMQLQIDEVLSCDIEHSLMHLIKSLKEKLHSDGFYLTDISVEEYSDKYDGYNIILIGRGNVL